MTTQYNFINNKYTRWYYAIIAKRVIKDKRRKGEVHHIIPSCLGGSDDPSNLVKLNGHDHAWCHWLLTKMTKGKARAKMVYAFNMMGVYGEHMDRPKSYAIVKAYERNRIEWSKVHSKNMAGKEPWNKGLDMKDDPRCKGGKKNKGRTMDPSVGESTRIRQTGKTQSAETSERKRQSMLGFERGPMSQTEKDKRSASQVGITKSVTHSKNIAAGVKGNISINKDGAEKKVKQPHLQSFLADGWSLGGRPRKKKSQA